MSTWIIHARKYHGQRFFGKGFPYFSTEVRWTFLGSGLESGRDLQMDSRLPLVRTWLWNVFSSAGGGQTHVLAGQDFKVFVSRHS